MNFSMRFARLSLLVAGILTATTCKTPEATPATTELASGTEAEGCQPLSKLDWMRTYVQRVDNGKLVIRVGVVEPKITPVGDILYLHGFADRIDNHRPLFEAWSAVGFRVIAFDYPSHGETCGTSNNIDRYDFTALGEIVAYVEGSTNVDSKRPLILSGWSTGGLLAIRMLQNKFYAKLSRPVSGAILFAPGVSVYKMPGDHGTVTEQTLTSNPMPPHFGLPSPSSPLKHPMFAGRLLGNGQLAWQEDFPAKVPALLFVGGDRADVYANTREVKNWVTKQRKHDAEVKILAIQCQGAKHELDNEVKPIGAQVRKLSAAFATSVVDATTLGVAALIEKPCVEF